MDRWRDPRVVRALVLRGLGAIYVSVFVSLWGQIQGMIGPRGLLPATDYLAALRGGLTLPARLWLAPTWLWLSASNGALTALVVIGLVAGAAALVGPWPRPALGVAAAMFLSFVAVAQDFAAYQSDGMLLEASLLALFWGPGARLPLFLLRWEWFRIYFESGAVKLLSGEEQWRHLTAMDKYYENGPLPTWIAWYAQQKLGHGFHAATAFLTLALELVVPFAMFAPRRVRVGAFVFSSCLQIGIISTANYAFLNYLVLLLGVTLLCDWPPRAALPTWRRRVHVAAAGLFMYCTVAAFAVGGWLSWPARALAPFRVANAYGLFAVMTRARHEIEFQGTLDGRHWVAYPFRFKPQDIQRAPGIYAPYQPRFDWDLWFASLDDVSSYPWVVTVEERLVDGEPTVLRLFAGDPFFGQRPQAVRAVLWQYWFTTPDEKRKTGAWWRREELGPYAPPVERERDTQTP